MWIVYALATAFFESLNGVFSKKSTKKLDIYTVSWSYRILSVIFLLPIIFFTPVPQITNGFWMALTISGILNTLATVLIVIAFKKSDISLVAPLIVITPLFLTITSPLIVGESVSALGLVGIIAIVLGAYLLNLKGKATLKPFKELLRQRGPQLMLIVALLFSITSNFDKIGVQASSPLFWIFAMNIVISLLLLPIVLIKKTITKAIPHYKTLIPLGLVSALTMLFQMIAINIGPVPYVIAIKRLSIIISIVWGATLFKEKNIRERVLGSLCMIAGLVLLTLT